MTAPQQYNAQTENDSKNVKLVLIRVLMWMFWFVPTLKIVLAEEESLESVAQEECLDVAQEEELSDAPCPDEESIHEKVDAVLMELYDFNLSLDTLGELLISSDNKCESLPIGAIIEHYTDLVNVRVGEIQEILTADQQRESDD